MFSTRRYKCFVLIANNGIRPKNVGYVVRWLGWRPLIGMSVLGSNAFYIFGNVDTTTTQYDSKFALNFGLDRVDQCLKRQIQAVCLISINC
jgi:hypothetical protein